MEYNILATTEKVQMGAACSQLWMNLRAIGDEEPKVNKTRIRGIIWGQTTLDPVDAIRKLREHMHGELDRYDKVFRVLPVLKWVDTSIENIVAEVEAQKHIVGVDDSFRVTFEKRKTDLKSLDVINPVAEVFDNRVDLENPDWVVLIEVMGDKTGVSIVPADALFQVQKERAALIVSG